MRLAQVSRGYLRFDVSDEGHDVRAGTRLLRLVWFDVLENFLERFSKPLTGHVYWTGPLVRSAVSRSTASDVDRRA